MLEKLTQLYETGSPAVQKDYYMLFSVSSFPNNEKRQKLLDMINFESVTLLKQKGFYKVTSTLLNILQDYVTIDHASFNTKNAITKLITECAFAEDGSLNMKNFDLQTLE